MSINVFLSVFRTTKAMTGKIFIDLSQSFRKIVGTLLLFNTSIWAAEPTSLFDGKTLDGWESNQGIWRVEGGAITVGSLSKNFPRNEFICTAKSYANFDLTLKIKCSGDLKTGQVNSGIQIRSARLEDGGVAGYQIDCGKGWFGKIFDEHRRRLIYPTPLNEEALLKGVDTFGWNTYRILAEGPRIQVWINKIKATDYTETNPLIPLEGIIAPQIHKGGHAMVQFKEVMIIELPATPGSPTWKSLGGVKAALAKVTPKKKPRRKKAPAPKAAAATFGRQVSESGIKHSFLIAGTPTVLVGEDGQVKWKIAGKARDGYVLENGNVLLSIGNSAKEFTPKSELIWSYQMPA